MENKHHVGRKHCVTSNFSFTHNVFQSYISLVHQNAVLCSNGLTDLLRRDWYFNKRLVFQQETGISTRDWYFNKRLVFQQETGISTRDWYFNKRLVFQQETGISTRDWYFNKILTPFQS